MSAATVGSNRRFARVTTPLGDLLVAADGDAVVGAYFDGQKHQPDAAWFGEDVTDTLPDDTVLGVAAEQLGEYFVGSRTDFDLPLAPVGTPFQQDVWTLLCAIPAGTTRTYGDLATDLAAQRAGGDDEGPNLSQASSSGLAQGVGQAVGHNPISVIVPCHRVVGADGSLTGFAGGLDRKRWLLAHEETDEARESRLF